MAGGVAGSEAPWPEIREELRLFPGPAGRRGEPSWTLHDPIAQRFFRLGWLEVEILNRWRLGSPEAIADAIRRETTLSPAPQAVEAVRNFVVANSLVVSSGRAGVARLVQQRYGRKSSLLSLALKNYLFIRIPLVKPDAFLGSTVAYARLFFSRTTMVILAAAALLALYLISRQWDTFGDSFATLLSLEGGVLAAAAVAVSKSVHELGHAYAAKILGLRVPGMGISLMCFAPVLWTDTTEAWKLPSRRQRLFIGAAGVMAEMGIAVPAAFLWTVLPPGALRTVAFIMASSTWILTLTVNINPCMRYDGYYLLSDYWEIPGLQQRSFALAKWRIREWLFGLGLPAPEYFEPRDRRKLIVYAIATWVYRFFLFLGIALMVYYLFFKALGIVLMTVELVFFIALPIGKEIMHWVKLVGRHSMTYRMFRSFLLLLALTFFLVYPWHGRVGGAGLLYFERQAGLYAPEGALVEEVAVANGSTVREGEFLFRLRSPDLEAGIALAEKRITAQRLKLSMASLDMGLRSEMAADWDELERLAEDLAGMLVQRRRLEFYAPFTGVMNDLPPWILPGSWVAAKEWLGVLTGGGGMVSAYVSEVDWNRIRVGNTGRFYPVGIADGYLPIHVVAIENQAVTEIVHPELASVFGGPLPVHRDSAGRLIPEQAVYRIVCQVSKPHKKTGFLPGTVSIGAEPRSLVSVVWNNFLGLIVRESDL